MMAWASGAIAGLFCFFLVSVSPVDAEVRHVYFVINAHGAKATATFVLPTAVSVYTPADLSLAYSYEDDAADPKGIENIFAAGRLPAFDKSSAIGGWRQYAAGNAAKVPDVVLTPLNFDKDLSGGETGVTRELKYLKENMGSKPQHWAYETGADSVLLVRRSNRVERIVGHQAVKQYMDAYNIPADKYVELNAPIVLFVPKHNKVKVLGWTSLSEVVTQLNDAFVNDLRSRIRVLMAACNEEGTPSTKRIVLSTNAATAKPIAEHFPN